MVSNGYGLKIHLRGAIHELINGGFGHRPPLEGLDLIWTPLAYLFGFSRLDLIWSLVGFSLTYQSACLQPEPASSLKNLLLLPHTQVLILAFLGSLGQKFRWVTP